jgi:hypothetical protein
VNTATTAQHAFALVSEAVPDSLKAATGPLMALAALCVAVGFLVLTLSDRKFKVHTSNKLGDIDIAVNSRPGPKLIDLVDWLVAAVQTMADKQGHDLPPLPNPKDANK